MQKDFSSRVPWSLGPSLRAKAEEVGVDFDRFMYMLSNECSDEELAAEFKVPEEVIQNLREQFERKGIHSIMGQD